MIELLERRAHPQQAYRSCFGLLKLAELYTNERLNAACQRALVTGAYRYKSVKSILERGLDKEPIPDSQRLQPKSAGHHENIRGAAYYEQLALFSNN